ncbi:MAG: helicase RepA family protein [Verrucomicrobia bacterium]|nr:helicase RepA family protein [Verrucomicrobiota bacterium]
MSKAPKDCKDVLQQDGPEGLKNAVTIYATRIEPDRPTEAQPKPVEPFPLTLAGELEGIAEAADFVEGLLTAGGASVVYGASNCGKSFWALDLAACVASGQPFRGDLECEQGCVIYVALEGTHGARNRIEALKRAGKLPDGAPLYLCFSPVSLLELGHAGRLAASVTQATSQSGLPCRLVCLDTLARAMAGGDENAGKDMTLAVQQIDEIRAATGAHVLTVHHCGKDEARGARGHSSLRAAMDTEIEVSRPEGESISTARITKQRDMPTGEPMPFTLDQVQLGTDRRGKPITSCLVHHEDSIMASTHGKAGRKVEVQPERLLELLPQLSTVAWQKQADNEMGVPKSTFYRHLEKLKAKNAAKQLENGRWDRARP